jgi:hypothetical protein
MRQQIVGTQAAVIRSEVSAVQDQLRSLRKGLTLQFLNNGSVSGSDFHATVSLRIISIPTFLVVRPLKTAELNQSRFPPRANGLSGEEAMPWAVFDTSDLKESDILAFKNMSRTLEIDTDYSYGDGFGGPVRRNDCWMLVEIIDKIPDVNYDGFQDCQMAKNAYRSALNP